MSQLCGSGRSLFLLLGSGGVTGRVLEAWKSESNDVMTRSNQFFHLHRTSLPRLQATKAQRVASGEHLWSNVNLLAQTLLKL